MSDARTAGQARRTRVARRNLRSGEPARCGDAREAGKLSPFGGPARRHGWPTERGDHRSPRSGHLALLRHRQHRHPLPHHRTNDPGGATVGPIGSISCAMTSLVEVLPDEPGTPRT
ncbi:hypothetical protein, partial [Amycolatopsis dendrobii]|uniref:hypothetical protein n=1 Tax=Amycolatopsis dendrobii TaxID=2760662 RepID=UPI001C7281DE